MTDEKPWLITPVADDDLKELYACGENKAQTKNWFETRAYNWLKEKVKTEALFLLAHADDGVIWGRFDDEGKLHLSGEAFSEYVPVKLRAVTLQQARLFGEAGELLVWQVEGGFRGRVLTDELVSADDQRNETHWLWGTSTEDEAKGIKTDNGFTLMRDGQQGLTHPVPIPLPGRDRRAGLKVRHYLGDDAHGQAYIALSRLMNVVEVPEKEKGSYGS